MHVMASTACRSLGLLCLREQLICLCLGPVCVAQSLTVGGWSAGYRVACTVSASYGQGLGEAGQIRGADRGTSAVPGRCPGIRWQVRFEFVRLHPGSIVPDCRWPVRFEFVPGSPGQGKSDFVPGTRDKTYVTGLVTRKAASARRFGEREPYPRKE